MSNVYHKQKFPENGVHPVISKSPYEEATDNLKIAIADAHSMIEALIILAEPHLPRHLFDALDNDVYDKALPSRVMDENSSMSRIVNNINQATNEVDRLTGRIEYLKNHLVT